MEELYATVPCTRFSTQRFTLNSQKKWALVSAGIENGNRYILTMNPLMSSLLARAEFVEADITFNGSREYPYLFNLVAFDDRTLAWAVVSRVRLDKQGAKAYALAFRKSFAECEDDHPTFQPGTTLTGVVTDWSDAEIRGLGEVIGRETAQALLKGCKVHWSR